MSTFHGNRPYGIALTGHRPDRLAGYDLSHPFYTNLQLGLEQSIAAYASAYGSLELHSGLALGADTVWSKAILRAREALPGQIRFVAHAPNPDQGARWKAEDQAFWRYQMEQADEQVIYGASYSPELLKARNIGMVDRCDTLFALYDGHSRSGTLHAINDAQRKGKHIVQVAPSAFMPQAPTIQANVTTPSPSPIQWPSAQRSSNPALQSSFNNLLR